MPTTEITEKIMNELNVSSGTGPDEVPARILRECSHELALPITLLVIRILFLGVWPEIWKDHWIVPLHKRGVTFKSKQYRGVHLTAQISKVVERVVKQLFVPYLDRTGAFGPNQFAYRQHRGARDALALLVMKWIIAFNSGNNIILYASDVSGAFDRVEATRLLKKLAATGMHPRLIKLLKFWLEPRNAKVIVGGAFSTLFKLIKIIFQGSVLGPLMERLLC